MKLTLVTYANEKFYQQQNNLIHSVEPHGIFDRIKAYREKDIDEQFKKEHSHILEQERGGGYWLWKPYFIYTTLCIMKENDVLLYMDCGDGFTADYNTLRNFLIAKMQKNNILLTAGGYPNREYTKRDCFIGMGCDEAKYHNKTQLEAGILVFKKSTVSMMFVIEWLQFCCDEQLLTDKPNTAGDNLPGFKDHRHDQSILSLLAIKRGIDSSSDMRNFITCNINT